MTEAQSGYLRRLSAAAGVPFDPSLSKAEASRRIDELRRGDRGTRRLEADDPSPRRGSRSREAASFDDRMTDTQATYLRELTTQETGEDFDPHLSWQQAQQKIAELLTRRMSRSPTEDTRG